MTRKMFSGFKPGWLLLAVLILFAPISSASSKEPEIKAMTRNLYLGADIFKVVDAALAAAEADPNDPNTPLIIPMAVQDAFETMQETNFPERAQAIADEIARFKPDVVGLQEVSTYYIQTPSDFLSGNPVQANTVVIDFYTVLNAALKARGMNYTAYTVTNADIELPMMDPYSESYLSDLRLVDHDVILVRKGYHASNMIKGNYQYQLSLNLGGQSVSFTRGYIAVDVNIKGDVFRFVNTHLELDGEPGSVFRVFQSAQMNELLTIFSTETKPIVLVGDLNSSPDHVPGVSDVPGWGVTPYVPPYMLTESYFGYKDSWKEQKHYYEAYTDHFDEYVSDPKAKLTGRYDHIFIDPKDLEIDKVQADIFGDTVKEMTKPSKLWPSDHAGVVAKIIFSDPCKKHKHGKNCNHKNNTIGNGHKK
jgi:endonuclease/exonuclease/phosphatase family metal-dependent hydrolase